MNNGQPSHDDQAPNSGYIDPLTYTPTQSPVPAGVGVGNEVTPPPVARTVKMPVMVYVIGVLLCLPVVINIITQLAGHSILPPKTPGLLVFIAWGLGLLQLSSGIGLLVQWRWARPVAMVICLIAAVSNGLSAVMMNPIAAAWFLVDLAGYSVLKGQQAIDAFDRRLEL